MKQIIFFTCLITACLQCLAQKRDIAKITDSITLEGKELYKSEMASWYGSDVFVAKCPNKTSLAGGYISYKTTDGVNNVFFSNGTSPTVLATITFKGKFDPDKYELDSAGRRLTPEEHQLYIIRQKTLHEINSDTAFKRIANTDFNLIPIVRNGVSRVYVLTGPRANGTVIIGNDYLCEFNDANQLIKTKRLHKSTLIFKNDPQNPTVDAVHSHLPETGDFITATDICTTMLYEKFAGWKFHVVISKEYVSSWDCQRDQLVILTKKAWERIGKDQNTKH
jgi:hypothetical protein